jgi:uroporphyrinogen decarboxylase
MVGSSLHAVASDGRGRVEAALALDVADRPPVSAWGHFYDREWDAAALAKATVAAARRYRFDFVKLQVRATCFAEAFGGDWRSSGSADQEPSMVRAGGLEAADWRRIAAGAGEPQALAEQVAVLRSVVAELGPRVPVIQTVFSPGMVAWFLAGRDSARLARLMAEEPGLMAAALETLAGALAGYASASLAAGAAGVFYAVNPLSDTTLVPADAYRRRYLPSDLVAFEGAAGGWFNMLHLCGGHINLEIAAELRPACLNWAAGEAGNPDLAEVRDRLGVAVAGGVDRYAPLRAQDPDEMRQAAATALAETVRRGHLLTPGCSSSPWSQVRPDLLDALVGAPQPVL